MDAQDFRSLQEAYLEVFMNEGLGGAKDQGDYEERERERERVRDEHLKKYKSGELPFQKQKKQTKHKSFLKSIHAKKELNKNKQTSTTSSSHTYLMKVMLKHQKQQKQLW